MADLDHYGGQQGPVTAVTSNAQQQPGEFPFANLLETISHNGIGQQTFA